jgi:hypothetical protein
MCAYECDFGDNDIITIVYDRSYYEKYVPVLSVLNLTILVISLKSQFEKVHKKNI